MKNVKYDVLARLELGIPIDKLVHLFNVNKTTIIKWKMDYERSKENTGTDEIKLAMHDALQERPETLLNSTDKLVKCAKGIDRLNLNLQNTADAINLELRTQINLISDVKELEVITNCLCKLSDTFCANKNTQIAIQQNFDSPAKDKYGVFLDD